MTERIIYLDNAATSYPKPDSVYAACDEVLRRAGNPGRGAHKLAYQASRSLFEARETVADFLGVEDSSRLVFTSGCTQSISLVLSGMLGAGSLKAGDTVLVSRYEHNAVMRALAYHERVNGIKVAVVPAGRDGALIDLSSLRRLLTAADKPALAAFCRASNVTGALLALDEVSQMLRAAGVPLLLDAAQSAGLVVDDLSEHSGVTFYVASGHKGLYGPTGIGLLYVQEGTDLDPPFCGGTGSLSDKLAMPDFLPDRLEPGTHGVQLAGGLAEGVRFVQERGAHNILRHEEELVEYFLLMAQDMPCLEVRGRYNGQQDACEYSPGALNGVVSHSRQTQYLPVLSFSFRGLTADRVADWLDTGYGIAIRSGLHCAISAHQVLNSDRTGLARVSFGAFNSKADIDALFAALRELAKMPA